MDFGLKDKVIFIAGASRGIGAATAIAPRRGRDDTLRRRVLRVLFMVQDSRLLKCRLKVEGAGYENPVISD